MTANKIPFSENLNLISMLTDAATVGGDLPYKIFWFYQLLVDNVNRPP